MPIAVVCDNCFAEFRVKDELGGKRLRCRSCEEPIKVPGGETQPRPAPRPRKPVLDDLDDWEDSEPEIELPRPRSTKTKKKKRRSKKSQFDASAVFAKISSFNVGPVLLLIAAMGMLALFIRGFYSPQAALICISSILIVRALMVIGAILGLFVIAAREHVMCFILCFVPFYIFWFALSRLDRTAFVCALWLGGTFGGWVVSEGVMKAYEVTGTKVNSAVPMHVGGGIARPIPNSIARIAPALSGDATSPLPVSSVPVPKFTMSQLMPARDGAGAIYRCACDSSASSPGVLMRMRLRLPAGDHPPQSLPCILIAPAGSTLLTGMDLDDINHTAETAPYVQAGYAVLEYSIDGQTLADGQPSSGSYLMFAASQAGVVNGRNALEFVLASVPQVNPNRIFAAGHSSAAVLALLLAEHEPRIKGCLAYAPATDVEGRLKPNLAQMDAERLFPGVYTFIKRSSPRTHAAQLNCPVFLFHAQDDSNEPISTTRSFQALLQSLGKQSTLMEVPTGDHYDAMIQQGIPSGIRWLQQLPGNQ